jgi:hypothetical protein
MRKLTVAGVKQTVSPMQLSPLEKTSATVAWVKHSYISVSIYLAKTVSIRLAIGEACRCQRVQCRGRAKREQEHAAFAPAPITPHAVRKRPADKETGRP